MKRKSVTFRLFDNPKKYNLMVQVLRKYENCDRFSNECLRSIYKEVFTCPSSISEINQLGLFIKTHKAEIDHHIRYESNE